MMSRAWDWPLTARAHSRHGASAHLARLTRRRTETKAESRPPCSSEAKALPIAAEMASRTCPREKGLQVQTAFVNGFRGNALNWRGCHKSRKAKRRRSIRLIATGYRGHEPKP